MICPICNIKYISVYVSIFGHNLTCYECFNCKYQAHLPKRHSQQPDVGFIDFAGYIPDGTVAINSKNEIFVNFKYGRFPQLFRSQIEIPISLPNIGKLFMERDFASIKKILDQKIGYILALI